MLAERPGTGAALGPGQALNEDPVLLLELAPEAALAGPDPLLGLPALPARIPVRVLDDPPAHELDTLGAPEGGGGRSGAPARLAPVPVLPDALERAGGLLDWLGCGWAVLASGTEEHGLRRISGRESTGRVMLAPERRDVNRRSLS